MRNISDILVILLFGVVLITCPVERAEDIAKVILDRRLAACINIIPEVSSLYWWEGKVNIDREALLIVKTRMDRIGDLERAVKEIHPYDVPEIIALPIVQGSREYMDWIGRELEGSSK